MDTFFTIYFIIVGVLLFLKLIYKMILFLNDEGEDWQFKLAEDVLDWCLETYPVRKQKPQLILVEGKSKIKGEYCFDTNTIIIYRSNNVLPLDVIRTFIHEYFHFHQITSHAKNNLYQKQLNHYGYEDHPQEILCNAMAETLTKLYLKNN